MVIDGQRQVLSRFLGSLEKWIVHQHPPIPAWQKSKRESVFLHTSVLAGSSSTPRMSRFILVLRQQSLIKDNFTFRYALITHQHGDDFHLRNVFAEDNQADGQRRARTRPMGPPRARSRKRSSSAVDPAKCLHSYRGSDHEWCYSIGTAGIVAVESSSPGFHELADHFWPEAY